MDINYYLNRDKDCFKEIICKKCGGKAIANTCIMLTSYPPQYNVDCPNCGRVYMFCHEVNNQLWMDMKNLSK